MLVCHCHRVNDSRVEQVLAAGAQGIRGVVRATHAGTGCGGSSASAASTSSTTLRSPSGTT